MAAIKPEQLIEIVRHFTVLYDQTQEQYRNSDYKDIIWRKVAKELKVEGQEEECKKKWNGIRDSLRRARQKRKTKSGQAATSTTKYKFEAILEFLIPHLAERKGLSNVPDEETESDETQFHNDSHQQNLQNSNMETPDMIENESTEAPEPPSLLTLTPASSRVPIEHRRPSAKRKKKEVKTQESPSSQLMAFLLAEKEAEKESEKRKEETQKNDVLHPVDAFLAGIAPALKSLDAVRFHFAKGKIFNIVHDCEFQQLMASNTQRNKIPGTSNVSSETPCFTPSEDEQSNADVNVPARFSIGNQQPTSPNDTEKTYLTLNNLEFFKEY